eukprot:jgi/Ulvmu1/10035/UM059_0084.1
MSRLLPLLTFTFYTAAHASPTAPPKLPDAFLLRQSQVDSSLSDHSRFPIRRQPGLEWQDRVQYHATAALQELDDTTDSSENRYAFPNVADSVHVYIMDSGIRASHSEFGTITSRGQNTTESRVQQVFSSEFAASQSRRELRASESGSTECAEHGTHVASLVGGLTFGVAKGVHIKSLEVLNCDGSTDAAKLITAMEWLGENVRRPAVVMMAIGEVGRIPTLDRAIEELVNKGVAVLAAAGNNDDDACATSPAGSPFTITVGAVDASRSRLRLPSGSGSNYGRCVDLYAPGEHIPGASAASDNEGVVLSGTSQAVALAAGVAAMHLHGAPNATPAQLRQALVSAALPDAVDEQLPGGTAAYTAPLLQVPEIGHPPRAQIMPSKLYLHTGRRGLTQVYSMNLELRAPAKADVTVALVERGMLRLNTPAQSVLPAGSQGGSFDLVVNETIALSTIDAESFFVDVTLASEDPLLDGRRLPVQVLDSKGMQAAYPKVALQTPFRDRMHTAGAGSQHQNLLDYSPCAAEKLADASVAGAAAGPDVVYFFKPEEDCTAHFSVCSSDMATEVAIFSGVDNVSQALAKFEGCHQWQLTCTAEDTVTLPLTSSVGYSFIARGSLGHTGHLQFYLQCGSTSGSLPTWAVTASQGGPSYKCPL